MVLQDIVVQTTVLDNIVTACRKTLPYAVAFTVEGSLKISLVTSEIIVIDVNETGEGKFKKRAKKKETINRTEDGITPPVPKRKRGRPRKVNYQEPVSESENDGDIVDNDTSGILGSESEIPDIKLETVEGVKEEVAESSDILNQQAELGMQALQSLAMQLSGEGDASSQPIEPSSSDLPATDQPPSDTSPVRKKRNQSSQKGNNIKGSKSALLKEKNEEDGCYSLQCHKCGMVCKTKAAMKNHQRVHKTKQIYICNECGKIFKRASHLHRHEMAHRGEKPFRCDHCGRQFDRADYLKIHMRTHTGEKPYQCSYCGKRFAQENSMNYHERIHTGDKRFKCTFCDKSFTFPHHKIKHERIHTGEKPYMCCYCERRFSRREHLKRHERFHTGEKPHTCSVCQKTFFREEHMRRHEKTHEQHLQTEVPNSRYQNETPANSRLCLLPGLTWHSQNTSSSLPPLHENVSPAPPSCEPVLPSAGPPPQVTPPTLSFP